MKVNWPWPCSDHCSLSPCLLTEMLKFVGHLQDVEIVEDGAKHTLVLYNCKVPQTGEVAFTAANAKCSANLKVKGELSLPHSTFLCCLNTFSKHSLVLMVFFKNEKLEHTCILSVSLFTLKSYCSSILLQIALCFVSVASHCHLTLINLPKHNWSEVFIPEPSIWALILTLSVWINRAASLIHYTPGWRACVRKGWGEVWAGNF